VGGDIVINDSEVIRALSFSSSIANENVNLLLQQLSLKDLEISSLRLQLRSPSGGEKILERYNLLKSERRALKKRLQENDLVIQALSEERNTLIRSIEEQKAKSDLKAQALVEIENNNFIRAENLLELDIKNKLTEAAATYYELGKLKVLQLELAEALKYFEKAALLDLDSPSFQFEVARTAHRLYDLDKAIVYFEKAIDLEKKINGEYHVNVGLLYSQLGNAYRDKGNYEAASKIYQQAFEINSNFFGATHPYSLRPYINTGFVYQARGKYKLAKKILESAHMLVSLSGNSTDSILPILSSIAYNLGRVYYELGDYDKALDYYRSTLSIDEIDQGGESLDVATAYNQLGLTFIEKKESGKAFECFNKVFSIYTKRKDITQHRWAAYYNNLALSLELVDRVDEAIEYYCKALEIHKSAYGEEHPDIAAKLNNLGNAFYKKGNYSRALEFNQQALEMDIRLLGESHHFVGEDYKHIGDSYAAMSNYNRALENYNKAFPILVQALGNNHYKVMNLLQNIQSSQQKLTNS
jgi:tetratricopeptide (TPR) repeat protein